MDLSAAPGSTPLKENYERYCIARMNGMKPAEAHIEAGLSFKTRNNWRLESKPEIKLRILYLKTQAAKKAVNSNAVTRAELIEELRDNVRIAKESKKPDLSAANRSIEILAKMHGFSLDVSVTENFDAELEGKSPEELVSFLLSMLEELDPNLHKRLTATESEPLTEEEGDTSEDRVLQ